MRTESFFQIQWENVKSDTRFVHVVQLSEHSSVKITIIAECTPIPTGRVTAMHGVGVVFVQDAFQVFNLPAYIPVIQQVCVYVHMYTCMSI